MLSQPTLRTPCFVFVHACRNPFVINDLYLNFAEVKL